MSDRQIINTLESTGYATEKEVTLKMGALSAEIGYVDQKTQTALKVHSNEHLQLEKALDVAAKVLNDKLVLMNEFRAQIDRERLDYVRREMLEQSINSLDVRIDALDASIRTQLQARSETLDARLKPLESLRSSTFALIGAAVVGMAILGVALRFLGV
jgi:hypothetical protein